MANMTFKTNLLPNSNLGYSLGSSDLKWNIYGDLTGKATQDGDGNTITDTYVKKSGDTMTGNLIITNTVPEIIAKSSISNIATSISTNSDGKKHGLWSYGYSSNGTSLTSDGKWMIYRDGNGNIIVNGKSTENVAKAGDTMTGNLYVEKSSEPSIGVVDTSNNNLTARLHVGSGHINHGLYSNGYAPTASTYTSGAAWLIARNATNYTFTGLPFYSTGFVGSNSKTSYNTSVGCLMEATGKFDIQRNATGNFIQLFDNNGNEQGRWDCTVLGTTSAAGDNRLIIGNNKASTATGNAIGNIYLGANGGWARIWGATETLGGTSRKTTRMDYVKATQVWGAVWNDYAEMRKTDDIEPGKCVTEVGDGTMILSTQRLQRGCKVTSDTYGFCIGQTKDCNTPIAVSGRVLVYLNESQEEALSHIGYPVCSGPNGTVSIMTDEEEEKYPSRIIGTISEVPTYEYWNGGTEEDPKPIKVNGRIWIYVK